VKLTYRSAAASNSDMQPARLVLSSKERPPLFRGKHQMDVHGRMDWSMTREWLIELRLATANRLGATPLGQSLLTGLTQGSSFLATLGCRS
jgi:hypothetical protein